VALGPGSALRLPGMTILRKDCHPGQVEPIGETQSLGPRATSQNYQFWLRSNQLRYGRAETVGVSWQCGSNSQACDRLESAPKNGIEGTIAGLRGFAIPPRRHCSSAQDSVARNAARRVFISVPMVRATRFWASSCARTLEKIDGLRSNPARP
jgi:hypothetical protein